jgi:ABC-2 type transport system permease protein
MLWYKAWLETRARFIIAIVGCTALCSMWMIEFSKLTASSREVTGLFYLLHGIHEVLAFVWILSVVLLMMGGLLQEHAVGISSFTLALPVSRFRVMSVRIITGLAEAFVLAVVPWLGMLLVSGLAGKTYPISQLCFHVFFLWSGGMVFVALAVLISSIVEGQYTAPVVSIGMSVLLVNALKTERLNPYSPWTFMIGSEYFQRPTGLLSGQFPLLHAAGFCAVAILLFYLSIRVIQQRDF